MENNEKTREQQLRKTVAQQQETISRLNGENAQLRLKIATLETKLEKALFYIEELQKIVFRGKKPKGDAPNSPASWDKTSVSSSPSR